MRPPIALAVALLAGCAGVQRPPAAAAPSPTGGHRRELVKRILRHNVRVFVMEGTVAKRTASGVVVGTELASTGTSSFVLTNAHVVAPGKLKDPRYVVVVDNGVDSLEYVGAPVAAGSVPEMDLALIQVRGVALEPVELATDDELALGDDVLVVAAPFGRALSLSGGMVSQVERERKSGAPTMLKTDAPIGYGASGGGVYSALTGRLLALVEGYRTAKVGFAVDKNDYSFDVPMPGETFAAPSAKVRRFLNSVGYGRLVSPARADEQQTARR